MRRGEPGVLGAGEQPGPDGGQPEPDEGSERGAEDSDRPNHASPRFRPAPACGAGGVAVRTGSASLACGPGTRRMARRSGSAARCCTRSAASAARTASASVPRRRAPCPGSPAPRGRAARGTRARVNPSRAASRNRRSRPPTERSSPSRPTSPMATVPVDDRPVAQRRREGQRERQVEAGLARRSGRRRGSRTRRGPRGRSPPAGRGRPRGARAGSGRRPRRSVAARARAVGATSAWTSTRIGASPRAPGRRRCPAPARRASARNARAGSATSVRPRSPISNTPDLLGRAVAVLRRAQEPQATGTDRPRRTARRRRDAPGSSGRRACRPSSRARRARPAIAVGLRELHQPLRRLAHLADAARRPVELLRRHRLDRVDHEQRRAAPRARAPRSAPRSVSATTRIASPTGPPASPRRPARSRTWDGRFLARRVQARRRRAAATPAAAWSRSVDLPIPGSPPSSTTRARPRDRRPGRGRARRCPRAAAARRRRSPPRDSGPALTAPARPLAPLQRSRPRRLANDGLDERVPVATGAALALPAKDGRATGLADVAALGAGHDACWRAVRRCRIRPRRGSSPPRSRVMSGRSVRVAVDEDRRARLVAPEEQLLRERVLDHVLDHPAQRPRAVGRS